MLHTRDADGNAADPGRSNMFGDWVSILELVLVAIVLLVGGRIYWRIRKRYGVVDDKIRVASAKGENMNVGGGIPPIGN
jgi:hypothetical protein